MRIGGVACVLAVALLGGCSRSVAETYCTELAECWGEVSPSGGPSQGSVDECVDDIDAWLDSLNERERAEAEVPVERCADLSDCEFVVCFCDEWGDRLSSGICEAAEKHL